MTAHPTPDQPALEIENLHLEIVTRRQRLPILRGVDLTVAVGGIHGLVGESGAGKTMIGRTVLGIQPPAARTTRGHIRLMGRDITHADEKQRRPLLGRTMSMILQDPMTALNPVLRIEAQITDVLRHRLGIRGRKASARALELLDAVHIRDPKRVLRQYPHELSGGMRQRVVISIAFACEPKLIIADEPTTALDVTVQRQILRLIKEMQARTGTAILFITHNLGVVAKLCDAVSVIYAGTILETAKTDELFAAPQHPYTRALFAATPRYDQPTSILSPVPPAVTDRLWREAYEYDARQPGH